MEIGFILMAAAGAADFAGKAVAGDAAKAAADFNASLDERNAALTEEQYAEEERLFRVNARHSLGGMRAAYAASGVSSAEGSAYEVIRQSAGNAEIDALKLRTEGQNKARALRDNARLQRMTGQAQQISSYLSGAGSLLGASGNIIDRRYNKPLSRVG